MKMSDVIERFLLDMLEKELNENEDNIVIKYDIIGKEQ